VDNYLPRDAAKKYGHFGKGTSFQNLRSYQNVWYPALYRMRGLIFELEKNRSHM